MSRLREKYVKDVVPELKKRFQYKNPHQVPALTKIVLNMGVGEAAEGGKGKAIENAANDMMQITGQKPIICNAKKSIANFKLRKGVPIGVSVTLRREKMFEFLDRFLMIALPRVRDFRGIPKNSFDGKGNYSVGVKEQTIFPEIDAEKTTTRGLSITFVVTAKSNEEGAALLECIGLPFRK